MKLQDALEVWVEIDGAILRAGQLHGLFGGGRVLASSRFIYDRQYLADRRAYELDPQLPLRAGTFYSGEDASLFGAFQDLAPDAWGEQLIDADLALARQRGENVSARIGAFDYLTLASDETRLGAVRFRAPGSSIWLGENSAPVRKLTDISAIAAAAARFESYEATEADLQLLGAPGTSAGGARPKVTAYINGQLCMIKLPSVRDRGVDGEAWECAMLRLARLAGITVQQGGIQRTRDGKASLVLRRFDRADDGSRIGYISARTAMGLSDQEQRSATYADFADTVDHLSQGNREQLTELFKRVAFTVLINNVDDHWKNHGLLRINGAWRLSPMFDVNPARSRGAVVSRPVSAEDDPRNRDIRSLTRSADVYRLTSVQAAHALDEVLQAVYKWAEVVREVDLSEPEIGHMAKAFESEQLRFAEEEVTRLGNAGRSIEHRLSRAHTPARPAAEPRPQGSRTADASEAGAPGSGAVWVAPHVRQGKRVEGHWRSPRQHGR